LLELITSVYWAKNEIEPTKKKTIKSANLFRFIDEEKSFFFWSNMLYKHRIKKLFHNSKHYFFSFVKFL
jgi:hypothetical protein